VHCVRVGFNKGEKKEEEDIELAIRVEVCQI